ncbi:hemerythrin domain-containing protein (plasmid) [Aliiroseovarius crassostreae]|uniref:hemerythrin domain-containing protein n=1 Tax=Aliiroseovarius crassostreae TaxID=154981 RepID=UPI00220F4309|nr:hemerythrin domain-containing protein [Aliiroseovarius crassostreae]UWP94027.1 hemerythrin domain-containing protein [Aliiroseovarius crassostreae]
MLNTLTIRTHNMPDEMQILLDSYPRESWDTHPGFREKTRHWLGAHQMFRNLATLVREDTETYLDQKVETDRYAGRLSYYGGLLVGNLQGHHGWEDHAFFPELAAADPRFDTGLEILEQDHADLDQVLDRFTRQANRVIKLGQLDQKQAREEAALLHQSADMIDRFLTRHLTDEEDLAVPIILHHRLRG